MICSSVPISRSRTTANAVSVITSTSVRLPITPGTKNQRLLRLGLYQGRCSSSTDGICSTSLRRDAVDAVLSDIPARSRARSAKCSRRRSARCSSWSRPRSPAAARSAPLRSFCAKPALISRPTVALPLSIRSRICARVRQLALHVEVRAGSKSRNQFAALLAVIQIEHHRRTHDESRRSPRSRRPASG